MSRTISGSGWLPKIAEAGLLGDPRKLEIVLVRAIRSLKRSEPEVATQLGKMLAEHSSNPNGLRWRASGPPPVDADEGLSLVQTEDVADAPEPILEQSLHRQVCRFLTERRDSAQLLAEGFAPPRSLLLTGAPGTGKTMLSRWIASELSLPFVSLDLATSISSFLGKTGFNLRRSLDFARSSPCVLLLDEFDAIAKRRDDSSEVGELKRIVNVLLKELEDWPIHSVLIAATNHPELLDRAISRRFDLAVEVGLPGKKERAELLKRAGGRFSVDLADDVFNALAAASEGASGSDLESMMNAAVRSHISAKQPLLESLGSEFRFRLGHLMGKDSVGDLVRAFKDSSLTRRKLASLLGKSGSTIQYHLGREEANG